MGLPNGVVAGSTPTAASSSMPQAYSSAGQTFPPTATTSTSYGNMVTLPQPMQQLPQYPSASSSSSSAHPPQPPRPPAGFIGLSNVDMASLAALLSGPCPPFNAKLSTQLPLPPRLSAISMEGLPPLPPELLPLDLPVTIPQYSPFDPNAPPPKYNPISRCLRLEEDEERVGAGGDGEAKSAEPKKRVWL